MRVAFIGIGNMGEPMAQNILNAGFELVVFNRTRENAEALIKKGAKFVNTPKEAALESDIIITMLSDDRAVDEVVLGPNGVLEGIKENTIHISSSTISVEMLRKIEKAHAEKHQSFISATIMGGVSSAESANLKVIAAGNEKIYIKVIPVLEAVSNEIFYLGDQTEKANIIKIGMNFLIASMVEALAEAQTMMEKSDIEAEVFMNIVNSVFQSPLYKNYGSIMTTRNFEPGFKMTLGLKDVELALDLAENTNSNLPLAALVQKNLKQSIENGNGNLDWAALLLDFLNFKK